MSRKRISEILELYHNAIRNKDRSGLSMRLRLFLFLVLFLNTIMLGVLLILFFTGVFKAGVLEHRPVLENELTHFASDSYRYFGNISIQTVDLANDLSIRIERNLEEHDASVVSLQENPGMLTHLLEEELDVLTGALEKSHASGVFLMLNATVNPILPNAENSRACLYLKNMEPNIINGMASNLRCSYGPITIVRNNKIRILPQWQMELDVSKMPFIKKALTIENEQKLPLSRLYHWSEGMSLPNSSERVMLCIMPLIASDGTIFGVCGLEISEMLFKLSYATKSETYDNLFCLLSPMDENILQLSGALFAGNYSSGPAAPEHAEMEIVSASSDFYSYRQPGKKNYAGLHETISLYPTDSLYADEQWAVALMVPSQDLKTMISAKNRNLILGLLALMLVNVALASFISRRYVHPVTAALESLKKPRSARKTNILEIDDLIEFLATQDELSISDETKELPEQERSTLYQEFVKNICTLSAAEKSVFDLYVKGHTAKEIAEILCLSINTIKTHNRRIYMKLNVASRKELMVYIQMMEEVDIANNTVNK